MRKYAHICIQCLLELVVFLEVDILTLDETEKLKSRTKTGTGLKTRSSASRKVHFQKRLEHYYRLKWFIQNSSKISQNLTCCAFVAIYTNINEDNYVKLNKQWYNCREWHSIGLAIEEESKQEQNKWQSKKSKNDSEWRKQETDTRIIETDQNYHATEDLTMMITMEPDTVSKMYSIFQWNKNFKNLNLKFNYLYRCYSQIIPFFLLSPFSSFPFYGMFFLFLICLENTIPLCWGMAWLQFQNFKFWKQSSPLKVTSRVTLRHFKTQISRPIRLICPPFSRHFCQLRTQICFVDLKSNWALLYNKGHNFWKSVSTQKIPQNWIFPY